MISSQSNVSFTTRKIHLLLTAVVLLSLALGIMSSAATASEDGLNRGRETGLPLPRFVSLKSAAVNLRVGPGRKYPINWQYKRRGLPVEVIQEFDQWRRIRDSEGSTGWVLHSLLSSRRTGIVAPWQTPKIAFGNTVRKKLLSGKDAASKDANTVAHIQAGLMVVIDNCQNRWCAVEAQDTRFWVKQNTLWGVYPGETVDG